jgi:hypothetical protein
MSLASTYHATRTLLILGDIPGEAQYLCSQDGEAAPVFGLVNIEDSSIQVIDRIFQQYADHLAILSRCTMAYRLLSSVKR